MRHILRKPTADAPPPCSPKSIYVLANLVSFPWSSEGSSRDVALILWDWKLNLQRLRDLALKDIESKLSKGNIVEEFFSRISAR
jgi:hypothetical protein